MSSRRNRFLYWGGFRDFARLANSDSEMWEGIISLNKSNIINFMMNSQMKLKISKRLLKMGNQKR
ncbi:MAG: hypothetical protein Ct9H90mP18_01870 [Gammaproteobacteria bacterium]|nr:MAG: hypothetical protein Ct9H90mP18_01870 [Gammaproteobacteria bacterium]